MALGGGHPADRRLDGVAVAVDALDDPLEHPAVLAEARPQELAVLVLAEPVDPEELGQLVGVGGLADRRASGRSSRPCCSRRTAAWRTGRGAARRRCRRRRRSSPSDMIEPRNTPCSQSKASVTSGTLVARRPPKRMAEIGTPVGVLPLGGDRRALRGRGGEAGVGVGGRACRDSGVQSLPFQSMRCAGGSSVMPSHHTSPSSVRATLVKMVLPSSDAHRVGVGRRRRCRGRRRRSRPRG